MKDKPKIHLKDIVEGTQNREVVTYTAGGVKYWGDRITKDQIATHADCGHCGNEFKKDYTYQRLCFNCTSIKNSAKYAAMEFKEWDGEVPLYLFDGDKYFFSEDDIQTYVAEDLNDGVGEDSESYEDASSLRLVICEPNYMKEFSGDIWEDDMPEDGDGELPKEIEAAISSLNALIKKQAPLSWSPGKYRTTVNF